MKKSLQIVAFVALCSLNAFGQSKVNSEDNHQLTAQARGAANECLQAYHGSFYEISSDIEVTGICFIDGFLKRVTFYSGPNCRGTRPCADFATRPIAYVDCNDNIISVNCL